MIRSEQSPEQGPITIAGDVCLTNYFSTSIQAHLMTLLTNQLAPDFSLPAIDGQRHVLSDYRGRWLLLVFHRHLG